MKKNEICPVCGKETGGKVPCPHCLTDTTRKIRLLYLWVICVILAVLGVGAFLMHVKASGEEPISISQIDTWMDYSHNLIEGTVTSGPLYGRNYISFSVSDFSSTDPEISTIEVRVYSPAFEELLMERRIPRVGDRVKIFGQTRVLSERDKMMTVSLASDIKIQPLSPVVSTPSDVLRNVALLYKRVTIEGVVTSMRALGSANIYYISDGSSEIQLYVPLGLEVYVEKRPLGLEVLDRVRITGGVSSYKGTPQLMVGLFSDIEVLGKEEPKLVRLSEISENLIGSYIQTSGKITLSEAVGTTTSLKITRRILWLDDVNMPKAYIEEEIFQTLPPETKRLVRRGSSIEFVGKVEKREGKLVVTFVGPQIPNVLEGEFLPPIAENLQTLEVDILATVAGRIVEISTREKGLLPPDRILMVESPSGLVQKVLIPNFVYERLPDPPRAGENINTVGKISVVGGEKVLHVCSIEDIWRV